jgi:6-pyruvoyltetrahydropterin/6-carboxytetrahydropterin synthase
MYILTAEASFDSAHFLAGYNGKCRNIHGHRWLIKVEAAGSKLQQAGQMRDMVIDFGDLKKEVKAIADYFDHGLIVEKNTLRAQTFAALQEEGFKLIEVDFRPTAEKLAKFIFDSLKGRQLPVKQVTVYETPANSAAYSEAV